ncbi:MAG: hypothetical protein PHQ12_03490 [Chthoniobacteraceae bacterium]|nr:hypothetical protein [Chthoniobacteraceae bacterium]
MKTSTKTARTAARQFALPNTETSLSPAVVPAPNAQDVEMAAQLTEQFRRARDAAQDAVIQAVLFGAMMLKLRQYVNVSACGHVVSKGGRGSKGDGLKGWLEKNAPEVSRHQAYDAMALAEGLQKHFQLKADTDIAQLLTGDSKEVGAKLAKKAEKIRKFLEGRSQRQLQLVFGNKPLGGKRERDPNKETPAEDPAFVAHEIWTPLLRQLETEGLQEKSWASLPQADLARLKGLLIDLSRAIKGDI